MEEKKSAEEKQPMEKQPPAAQSRLESCWQKLSRKYDQEGKLTQYPSKQSMRIFALLKIAEKFETEARYREKEVNEIIRSAVAFSDVELVRREMYQYRILGRFTDGSSYWLETGIEERYGEYLELLKKQAHD